MKSQRRHELQQNVLDAELAKIVQFFRKHGTRIAWGALVAALIALGAVWAWNKHKQGIAEAHLQYARLQQQLASPDARQENVAAGFLELSATSSEDQIAAESAVCAGDAYARLAIVETRDADRRAGWLEQATNAYKRAVTEVPDEKVSVAKAHYGLAKIAETRGDFETARMHYNAVLAMTDLKGEPVARLCEQSRNRLEEISEPVRMASTKPTEPQTQSMPATGTQPASSQPETKAPPTQPAKND